MQRRYSLDHVRGERLDGIGHCAAQKASAAVEGEPLARGEKFAASAPEIRNPRDAVAPVDRDLAAFAQLQQVAVLHCRLVSPAIPVHDPSPISIAHEWPRSLAASCITGISPEGCFCFVCFTNPEPGIPQRIANSRVTETARHETCAPDAGEDDRNVRDCSPRRRLKVPFGRSRPRARARWRASGSRRPALQRYW